MSTQNRCSRRWVRRSRDSPGATAPHRRRPRRRCHTRRSRRDPAAEVDTADAAVGQPRRRAGLPRGGGTRAAREASRSRYQWQGGGALGDERRQQQRHARRHQSWSCPRSPPRIRNAVEVSCPARASEDLRAQRSPVHIAVVSRPVPRYSRRTKVSQRRGSFRAPEFGPSRGELTRRAARMSSCHRSSGSLGERRNSAPPHSSSPRFKSAPCSLARLIWSRHGPVEPRPGSLRGRRRSQQPECAGSSSRLGRGLHVPARASASVLGSKCVVMGASHSANCAAIVG